MPVLAEVQRQYEVLPYPPRDPERELEMLRQPAMCSIARANALLWAGRRALGEGFRVLDAGCGTGDNTVFLREQLRGTGAEVVSLDFSSTSLDIARRRVEARGLQDGGRFVLAAIEDAPALGLGEFDLIFCSGVLHHLASPEEGMAALRAMLKADGAVGAMVYARYGREPVYGMQALMRYLAPAGFTPERRLRVLRRTLATLPSTNRALRGLLDHHSFAREIEGSDAGAYDLLLHTQDRPYTVPEVHEWLDATGMRLAEWVVPRAYDPLTYVPGADVSHLDAREREAAAELMHGGMTKHEFFAVRHDAPPLPRVAPDDDAAVPVWCAWDFTEQAARALDAPGDELRCSFGAGRDVLLPGDRATRAMFRTVDGRASVGEVLAAAQAAAPAVTPREVRKRWLAFYGALRGVAALSLYAGDAAG